MVPFPDYNAEELAEIAVGMLAVKQQVLSPAALTSLQGTCERQAALGDPMSGNARFVRNLLEKAAMRQAERLCALPDGGPPLTREQLVTLEACDIAV